MTKLVKPFVLHVDDEPEDLRTWQTEVNSQGKVDIEVCHPQEVTAERLRDASLVLVDLKLDNWPERAGQSSLALSPPNGLAVLATLQEIAQTSGGSNATSRPKAYALYTGAMREVARHLVPQPHIVARAHNIDWIFEKANTFETRVSRVSELAVAVAKLPEHWPGDTWKGATEALHAWLELPKTVTWREAASRDLRRCCPPIHEFAEHTHGIGVVRWALQKILPYPTFLLDDAHLAARLRVSLESLRAAVETEAFKSFFGEARYQGQLSSFLGGRWWRAGVEHVIFEATPEGPGDLDVLHEVLRSRIPELRLEGSRQLFPVLGPNFITRDTLATSDQIVEVRPDDWPSFADEAWALRSDLEELPGLNAVAVEDDR